jgi:hypothetical protein
MSPAFQELKRLRIQHELSARHCPPVSGRQCRSAPQRHARTGSFASAWLSEKPNRHWTAMNVELGKATIAIFKLDLK